MKYTIRTALLSFVLGWVLSANFYGLSLQHAQISAQEAEYLRITAEESGSYEYYAARD